MPYPNLLVHVQDDDDSDARIRLAISLARRFGAKLTGVAAAKIDPVVSAPTALARPTHTGAVTMVDLEFIESGLRAAEARFRRIITASRIRTSWHSRLDYPAEALCLYAMTSDLVVAGRRAEATLHAPQSAFDPADVIMKSGRPVLVVPPGMPGLSGARVVVGWKNTREARRAIIDALPFLQAATQVSVVEFARRQDMPAAREQTVAVADFLRTHGVAATSEAVPYRRGTTAEQIVAFAEQANADLIVAGAYGHTWLHEWIFGGVTQVLLQRCPVCCLLSH
ncbi:universal stress protein [Labrys okinawensis]|uniref:universal stress protein n=1 Tax=Labrys okinawensis TaxID=346911 RepID=UPI0039BCC32D